MIDEYNNHQLVVCLIRIIQLLLTPLSDSDWNGTAEWEKSVSEVSLIVTPSESSLRFAGLRSHKSCWPNSLSQLSSNRPWAACPVCGQKVKSGGTWKRGRILCNERNTKNRKNFASYSLSAS